MAKTLNKLSPLTIKSLVSTAKKEGRVIKAPDGGGLYFVAEPERPSWWRFDYRINGKQKTLSVGLYPEISIPEARVRRSELREQAAQAIGPDAVVRVQAWRNELERTKLVVDEMAPLWNRIGESFGGALNGMITGAQSWRNALANIFQQVADAFLQQIVIQPFQQWIAMQAPMSASSAARQESSSPQKR